MELFYNPQAMPEEEIKKTFVARHHLLDELVSLIEHQPDGAGIQHVIIIAPRGMGKTTMLLMVQFAVRDRCLSSKWQTVQFPEESYAINDLADFWTEVIDHLAFDTSDEALRDKVAELRAEYTDSDDLLEAALAVIKDWSRKHGKRMLLLIDNLDMIFEQINDTRDNARLREVLMNDGTMMILGGATTFFREVRDYDQPLYNFFKIYNLEGLRFEQMTQLLRQRAEIDKRENFEETLRANTARLRVLEYFTGGNPRLLLMLYRVATQSDISQSRRGLEKLLDEVTPYFKAKTESLPAQQRKILDFIARESSRTQEGVTPTQVAGATRMTANQASAQLKRLAELGYVQAANLRGRSSYYALSEPLYAIWYKMRMGRDARQRMEWLVDFLRQWYEAADNPATILEQERWRILASVISHEAEENGHIQFARQLIRESELEEPLFPLARAIDYLLTGDEALIEKLSPEVRGIVEEIVAKLGKSSRKIKSAQATARKKKTAKKKSGPRSRVRKQLV
jgi:DNA-binding transcriptional ArsR family regulator